MEVKSQFKIKSGKRKADSQKVYSEIQPPKFIKYYNDNLI